MRLQVSAEPTKRSLLRQPDAWRPNKKGTPQPRGAVAKALFLASRSQMLKIGAAESFAPGEIIGQSGQVENLRNVDPELLLLGEGGGSATVRLQFP